MRILLTALLFGSFVFCTPAASHAIGDPDKPAGLLKRREPCIHLPELNSLVLSLEHNNNEF
jgi:hypothetical protein